jgi:hypothetical protein
MRSKAKWIKAHLMCGVKTHVVTSAEVTPNETADAPQLPQLLNNTAKTFEINEVSADKAYSSKKNLHSVVAVTERLISRSSPIALEHNGTVHTMASGNACGISTASIGMLSLLITISGLT